MAGPRDYEAGLRQLRAEGQREEARIARELQAESKRRMEALAANLNSKAAAIARSAGVSAVAEFKAESLAPVSNNWTVVPIRRGVRDFLGQR